MRKQQTVLRQIVEKALAGLGALLFLSSIAGVFISFTEQPGAVDVASAAANPPATVTVAPSPSPTPPPALEWLPGLSAYDVTVNLAKQRFECNSPDLNHPPVTWHCTRTEDDGSANYAVSITGNDSSHVRSVEAQAIMHGTTPNAAIADGFIASDFLSSMASIPYDGADMNGARKWVKTNIAEGGETTIGGVKFTLSINDQTRTLEVSSTGPAWLAGNPAAR